MQFIRQQMRFQNTKKKQNKIKNSGPKNPEFFVL